MALAPERAALLYAHHGAPGDLAFEVGGKSARKLIEINGARDDARKVTGPEVRGDALTHREPPLAARRRGVDDEARNHEQDEVNHGSLVLRPSADADAGTVYPALHVTVQAR